MKRGHFILMYGMYILMYGIRSERESSLFILEQVLEEQGLLRDFYRNKGDCG